MVLVITAIKCRGKKTLLMIRLFQSFSLLKLQSVKVKLYASSSKKKTNFNSVDLLKTILFL